MPSLAAFLRSVKFKKSPSETESLLQNPPAKRRSCPLAPQVRLQRTNSATGPESFNMFRRKVNPNSARPDNPDILEVPETPGERDVEKESKIQHLQQNFSSQSQPITNDLLELHVDPPKSLHPISDAPNISTISRDTITGESTSNISSQSPLSLSTSPIRESHSPHATNHKPPFLTLPSPTSLSTPSMSTSTSPNLKPPTSKLSLTMNPHLPNSLQITTFSSLSTIHQESIVAHGTQYAKSSSE